MVSIIFVLWQKHISYVSGARRVTDEDEHKTNEDVIVKYGDDLLQTKPQIELKK